MAIKLMMMGYRRIVKKKSVRLFLMKCDDADDDDSKQ